MGMMINRRRVMGLGSNKDLIYLIERDITSINIPNGTTKIGNYTFCDCASLTSVTIPNTVTSIGNYAFAGTGLISITIPNNVTQLGIICFQNCWSLVSADLGDGISNIGTWVFRGCSSLTTLIIRKAISPYCTISSNSLTNTPFAEGGGRIYVPYSADHSIINAYKTATNWNAYANQIYELDENGNIPT